MHRVIISLAANRFQKRNLAKARERLGEVLSDLRYTSELWTAPVNAKRQDAYLNQLATAVTELTLDELNQRLKSIEQAFGRTDEKRRLGIVPIDLDVLQYDRQRCHLRDWERPYTQQLLPELPPS